MQLLLNIEKPSLLPLVQHLVSAVDGLSIASTEELAYEPNACTLRAIKASREGKVHRAQSADDLIDQILA